MEARCCFLVFLCATCWILTEPVWAQGQYRTTTTNFVIMAPDPNLSREAGRLAEQYRRELSMQWLGYEIKNWKEKCPVQIQLGPHAGGETSFAFMEGHKSEPMSWQMKIFGPPNRILDAVLPHEITHTIFATHFGQPLPRWADEGACTTVEHESERKKNHEMLMNFLTTKPSRGIPFNRMFTMKRYPHDILPLYAQGYSLAKFLIAQKGHVHFVKFIEQGLGQEQRRNQSRLTDAWDKATQQFYGYQDLSELQIAWIAWVRQGSPADGPIHSYASTTNPTQTSSGQPASGQPITGNQPKSSSAASNRTYPTAIAARQEAAGSWYSQKSAANQASTSQAASSGKHFSKETAPFQPGSTSSISKAEKSTQPNRSSIWR